jgi:uracil-DNA glycosylase
MILQKLLSEIHACTHCEKELPCGPRPVIQADSLAYLRIIGQAPGRKVHETGIPWNDKSGERLRQWLGLAPKSFYDSKKVALVPIGFCYPGKAKSGDLSPRPECAPLWHTKLNAHLPNVKLTLLVGQFFTTATPITT